MAKEWGSRSFLSGHARSAYGRTVIVLGIDTSGIAGSVALVEDTQVLASFHLRQPSAFSSYLLRMIDLVCHQAGCQLSALAGIAVNLGPGAFTSLRVGLATAQGLAMACGKPLVGWSTFDVLARLVGWEGMICPVLEARRGEVYAALYRRQGSVVHETTPGMVMTPEALCALITERTLFLGSGMQTYRTVLTTILGERAVCVEVGGIETGIAAAIARLGCTRLGEPDATGWTPLTPLYIRPADARLPAHMAALPAHTSAPLAPSSHVGQPRVSQPGQGGDITCSKALMRHLLNG
jgi:tRNA threonylcarbamoyladenosine biosynthesis protein TsaB